MKPVRAQLEQSAPFAAAQGAWRQAISRVGGPNGTLSVDGLDAMIRALGVATVVVLSLAGYGRGHSDHLNDMADPFLVAGGLVLYNLLVILAAGVPWRRAPGFPLFVVDWAIASVAILVTGGSFSPFIILYYSLAIGAALRVGLSRSLIIVAACALVYVGLSVTSAAAMEAFRLPILVVQVTSLVMVALTAVAMKRAVEVEARRVELEERAAGQLRLLHHLTNTVLSASPDLERVMRTVAAVSSEAVQADSGLAVMFKDGPVEPSSGTDIFTRDNLLLVSDRAPDPPHLSEHEKHLLGESIRGQAPILLQDVAATYLPGCAPCFPGLERSGSVVRAVACVPFLLGGGVLGVLFVGRYTRVPFGEAEVNLLGAIGQQMAVAVRLARLYEMEREKAARSEERERLERDLLSMVSHELRTPLTAIKTSVGALTEADAGPASQEDMTRTRLLHNIERSTDRLTNLVAELLDSARLRAGRVSLKLQQLNLGEVIVDLAPQVRPLLDARGQRLALDLPMPGSGRWARLVVSGDRRRLEQVLLNLLANANRYGPSGGTITVGATPRDGQVKVFVRDEGPGIEPHEQGMIFEKFYQGQGQENAAEARPESLGLGLAIARSIVELHGGQIGVRSSAGQGSTFYFTLAQIAAQPAWSTHENTDN
jgi:signal transduction histidine kinase